MDKAITLQISDSFGYQISLRSFIEAAIKPAMKTITLLLFETLKINMRSNEFFEQIIITFEDIEITTDRNRDRLFQQILQDILRSQIAEFCDKSKYYIKEDFTLLETRDICNEIISKNLYDLYTVNHKAKIPYLAFRSTYAIKFCQPSSSNEDELRIYAIGSKQENPKMLDLDKYHILVRRNDIHGFVEKDYRVCVPSDNKKRCVMEFIRINGSVEEDSFEQSYMDTLDYITIGHIDLRSLYLQKRKHFPIISICIKPHFRNLYLSISVSTIVPSGSIRFRTVEPLMIKYMDY